MQQLIHCITFVTSLLLEDERADVQYVVDNVEIPMVNQYKYLECVIDEQLELNDMVEEKVVAGKKAVGAWFSQCRVEVGDIQ